MKVGVIMGGISSEIEVSLNTGKEMMNHLDRNQYEVIPVVFNKPEELVEKVKGLDFALLALHGAYGEDGTIQGMLETLGIPYTGSGVLASSLCMNKDLSKKILRYEGVYTPDWLCWDSLDDYSPEAVERLGYPVMVKPNSGGSSIGMEKVNDEQGLHSAVLKAFMSDTDQSILIERYIVGQEITCSILDGELLPVVGITSASSEWFDYSAKYEEGGADEVVLTLPPELEQSVRRAAMTCYKALKCSVYARVDILLLDGDPYVLEVNTLPGMTSTSLLPKSSAAAGLSFSALLDRIISCSLTERSKNKGVPVHVE
ncbi:D-alanine--D-alanine ligase [Paenibacillus macquariensis]|nr:D-alanine--D-alanine ligase [Paenibacillus macquariensis]MEC0093808.1 D-alanine--D-alanine ligase [Paenibacillus macquariensis]OAB26376.1 D-alanine--D-alanine ligase [Paenibacillus macquariensis subsp. macquariensis]